MELTGQETVIVEENVVWKEIDGKLVVLNLSNGFYFTLNDSARTIWGGFEQKKNITSITEEVVSRYNISKEQVMEDISHIINQCLQERLIVVNRMNQPQ